MNGTAPSAIVAGFYPDAVSLSLYFSGQMISLILGLPIHSFTLWLTLTRTGSRETLQIFNLNLAVAEILCSLSAIAYVVEKSFGDEQVYRVKAFFGAFSMSVRPLFQMCVCVERYLAVLRPLLFLRFKAPSYRLAVSALVWLIVLGVCVSSVMSLDAFPIWIYGPMFLLVYVVDVFCCMSVIWTLSRPTPGDRHGQTGRGTEEGGMQAVKKKAVRVMLINCLALMVHTLPFCITFFVTMAWKSLSYRGASISTLFIVAAGFIQPMISIWRAVKTPVLMCLSNQKLRPCLDMQSNDSSE